MGEGKVMVHSMMHRADTRKDAVPLSRYRGTILLGTSGGKRKFGLSSRLASVCASVLRCETLRDMLQGERESGDIV